MKVDFPERKVVPRILLPILAILIVASSVFYSGVHKDARWPDARSKDIDTKYFYVAAKCWAAGKSPYEPATYDAMFQKNFGIHTPALFVAYLPTLMLVVLPMAPFKWTVAAKLFSLLNFGAAMVLFWACYRLVKEEVGELKPVHWFWIVIASTVGAITGTIVTGQTSVFVTAAIALAVAGCRINNPWLVVAGLVIATAKPHLVGPLFLFILLFEPLQRRAIAIAIGIVALVFGYAAMVDVNLLHSYINAVKIHAAMAINDPSDEVGIPSLLLRAGVAQPTARLAGVLCLLAIIIFAAVVLRRSRTTLSRNYLVVMLLVFSIGVGEPLQGYDLCAYCLAIALVATLAPAYQLAYLVPALLIWRPNLLDRLQHFYQSGNVSRTNTWLFLLVGTILLAAYRLMTGRKTVAVDSDERPDVHQSSPTPQLTHSIQAGSAPEA